MGFGVTILGVQCGGQRLDGRQVALLELQSALLGQLVLGAQGLAHEGGDIRADHHRGRQQDHGAGVKTIPPLNRERRRRGQDRSDQHHHRGPELENRRGEYHDHQEQDR